MEGHSQQGARAGSRGVGRRRWGIACVLGLGVLVNYIDRGALSVAQQPLHDEFGLGAFEFGLLSSAFFWIYALLQIPVGLLLDRFGVTVVARVSAFFWSIASALTALSTGFVSVFAARSFLGVAEAPTFPANAKAVGYWFPKHERGRATSLFDAAAKLSNAIGVPLSSALVVALGWRGMFWTSAALSLAFFALLYVFYRNPGEDPALSPEERAYIAEGGAEPEAARGTKPKGAELSYILRQPKIWGLTLGFAAYGYLFALLLTWLPAYLQKTFGVNILKAGLYAGIAWGTGTVTDLVVGGFLVDHLIGKGYDANKVRKTVLIVGLVMGFAVIGAAYTKDINVAIAWITVATAGIAFHAPVGWSIPALIAPRHSTGTVSGIMNLFNNLAGFVAPTVTGLLVARTGSFSAALITAAVILVFGIIAYVFVLGKIEPIPEPQGEPGLATRTS